MRSTGVNNLITVIGISTVSSVISEIPKRAGPLLECSDYGELQSIQLELLPYGCLRAAIQPHRQLFGQQHDMLALPHIALIQKTAR